MERKNKKESMGKRNLKSGGPLERMLYYLSILYIFFILFTHLLGLILILSFPPITSSGILIIIFNLFFIGISSIYTIRHFKEKRMINSFFLIIIWLFLFKSLYLFIIQNYDLDILEVVKIHSIINIVFTLAISIKNWRDNE